jgi:hypothetical protein
LRRQQVPATSAWCDTGRGLAFDRVRLLDRMSDPARVDMTIDQTTGIASPAFLRLDHRVPPGLHDLLTEADGCLEHGFLTGGTACALHAVHALLTLEKAEGADIQTRLRALSEKHAVVPQMLTTVLSQIADVTAGNGATLSANSLHILTVTLKALLHEVYVIGPERVERLQYVAHLIDDLTRKAPDKPVTASPIPAAAASAPVS